MDSEAKQKITVCRSSFFTPFKLIKMNKLTSVTFLIPVIALILVVALYFILSGKTENKSGFKRFTFIALALAFLLNFVWEILQMPLYKGTSFSIESVAFCALASIADAIMIILLYYIFALIYKEPLWIKRLTAIRIFALAIAGGAGAVLAEVKHVSTGSWAYTDAMPVIPYVDVGLSPVVQFMILPVTVYYITFYLLKNTKQKKSFF